VDLLLFVGLTGLKYKNVGTCIDQTSSHRASR